MSFSEDFLKQLEPYAELSPQEKEVFLEIFARGKSRVEVTQVLYMSESNLSSCFGGIYKKFRIGGRGPGKESRLREHLSQRYQEWKPSNCSNIDGKDNNIDVLVQEIRKQIKPSIKQRCGTMRVLDMEQPIKLTGKRGIYTNVNILEKISGRRRLDITEFLQNWDVENFNRFGLNDVREKRVLGIEAVKRYRKLMVLGKPGAGKTTFLKYLAMQCIEGNFLQEYVPIFITLKDFAEAGGEPDLLTYICQTIHVEINVASVKKIFQKGCAFILLDGLDEVREEDTKRVLRHILDFSDQFHINQFVITCRIAAKEYTFESFTEVEVADFDKEQIAIFAQNWFRAKDDLVKAEKFIQRLEENKPIQELATNPLLLTLLCLVFGEAGNFPANRSELYEEGLDVLLKKWDAKRNIERDVVYKNFSVKRKEDLLSQIALTTFENKDYFFKQKIVEGYIADFIYNLPNARLEPEELELDSEAVLKSIESQHGLLMERARGIYSFSHLTFQEYFTAREIVETRGLTSLKKLVNYVTDNRWHEVFLLTAEKMRNADELALLMKDYIDKLIAANDYLQVFLEWVYEKTILVNVPYKLASIRAFYFAIVNYSGGFKNDYYDNFSSFFPIPKLSLIIEQNFYFSYELMIDAGLLNTIATASNLTNNTNIKLNNESDDNTSNKQLLQEELHELNLRQGFWDKNNNTWVMNLGIVQDLYDELSSLLKFPIEDNLRQHLLIVIDDLKSKVIDRFIILDNLKNIAIEDRNIGYDWDFSNVQKQLLQQYYDANKLLVDCLNSDCYISREVRQEIEDTLLLPMSEIKQRQGI